MLKIDIMICLKNQRPKSLASKTMQIQYDSQITNLHTFAKDFLDEILEENPELKALNPWPTFTLRG